MSIIDSCKGKLSKLSNLWSTSVYWWKCHIVVNCRRREMLLAHASAVEHKMQDAAKFSHTDHCEAAFDAPLLKVNLLSYAKILWGLCVQSFICGELHHLRRALRIHIPSYTYSFVSMWCGARDIVCSNKVPCIMGLFFHSTFRAITSSQMKGGARKCWRWRNSVLWCAINTIWWTHHTSFAVIMSGSCKFFIDWIYLLGTCRLAGGISQHFQNFPVSERFRSSFHISDHGWPTEANRV